MRLHFRLRDDPKAGEASSSSKRYVITAPPAHFPLLPSDLVYVLIQFDPGTEYTPHWMTDRQTGSETPRQQTEKHSHGY